MVPLDDPHRLAVLRDLAILDTPPEPDFDDLAVLAAAVGGGPVGAVNLVDDRRHFTKAVAGAPEARGASVPNDLSFCAATVATPDGLLEIPDTHADARWREHPFVTDGPRVGSYLGAAIEHRGERVGVVCAFGPSPRPLGGEQREAIRRLARQASAQLELRHRNRELRALAVTDPLTGLPNRAGTVHRLTEALAARADDDATVGVLFCDLDGLKAVNDRDGHAEGDRLLCTVAERVRGLARAGDTVGRFGGDEFVVVLPGVAGEAALRAVATRAAATDRPGDAARLSVGAVLARPGETAEDVLRRADDAMYAVKAEARTGTGTRGR